MKIDINLSDNEIDRLFYELVLAHDDEIDDEFYLKKVLMQIMKGIEPNVKKNCYSCMSRVSENKCWMGDEWVDHKIENLNSSCEHYENRHLYRVVK